MIYDYSEMKKGVDTVAKIYADRAADRAAYGAGQGPWTQHVEAMAMQAMLGQIEMEKVILLAAILEKMPDKPIGKDFPPPSGAWR